MFAMSQLVSFEFWRFLMRYFKMHQNTLMQTRLNFKIKLPVKHRNYTCNNLKKTEGLKTESWYFSLAEVKGSVKRRGGSWDYKSNEALSSFRGLNYPQLRVFPAHWLVSSLHKGSKWPLRKRYLYADLTLLCRVTADKLTAVRWLQVSRQLRANTAVHHMFVSAGGSGSLPVWMSK